MFIIPFCTKLMLHKKKSLAFITLFLLLFPACTAPVKTTVITVALTDGTHTGGGLIAVDSDWLILSDPEKNWEESPLTLIDYGLIDSVRILGGKYDRGGAVLGGLIGAVGGIFASGALDSASPRQERSRFVLGFGIGLVSGAALGYFVGSHFADSDIILAHPDDTDYAFLRQYALYPDTIPHSLELAIDSIEESEESEY